MTVLVGSLLGAVLGLGAWMAVTAVLDARRTPLAVRVLPYVRDLPRPDSLPMPATSGNAFAGVFGPSLQAAARTVERVLGGAASVRRRLVRAGLEPDVAAFRVEQVIWGLVAFAIVAVPSGFVAAASPDRAVPLLIFSLVAFVLGVLLRENRLSAQVARRERLILEEFPTVAELLALSVAAGESPSAALDRVVRRTTASCPPSSPRSSRRSAPARRSRAPSTTWPRARGSPWSRASRRASRSPSSVARHWPTSSTRRPATSARPAAAR